MCHDPDNLDRLEDSKIILIAISLCVNFSRSCFFMFAGFTWDKNFNTKLFQYSSQMSKNIFPVPKKSNTA